VVVSLRRTGWQVVGRTIQVSQAAMNYGWTANGRQQASFASCYSRRLLG
jgi:hypothetical protein